MASVKAEAAHPIVQTKPVVQTVAKPFAENATRALAAPAQENASLLNVKPNATAEFVAQMAAEEAAEVAMLKASATIQQGNACPFA